jgi:alkanesulfonate monooxygenase SsuD/methylene tetrahydromethanopterin reductase-like flavin-dependent oxidoreductase (luciferase family)
LSLARWAEAEGLAAVALPDHYLSSTDPSLPGWDNLMVLAGLARDTERIQLVSLVSPITFRHPAVYAKTAVTLAEMSGGRFTLGLGTGWMEEEHRMFGLAFPQQKQRFAMLEEALAYLQAHLAGEGFQGDHYQLEEWAAAPRPPVPIVIGGTGAKKTPTLAGRYGDEYNAFVDPGLADRIKICREAAAAAGRDPQQVMISCVGGAVVGSTEELYRRALEGMAGFIGRPVDQLEPGLKKRGRVHGLPDKVRGQMAELEALGVRRFYIQLYGLDDSQIPDVVSTFRG